MKIWITIILSFIFLSVTAQVKDVGIVEKDTTSINYIKQLPDEYYSFNSLKECQEQVADINKMNGYPRQGALTYCECTKNDTIYYLPVDDVLNRYEEILMKKEGVIVNKKQISATKLNTEYKQLPIRKTKKLNIKK